MVYGGECSSPLFFMYIGISMRNFILHFLLLRRLKWLEMLFFMCFCAHFLFLGAFLSEIPKKYLVERIKFLFFAVL